MTKRVFCKVVSSKPLGGFRTVGSEQPSSRAADAQPGSRVKVCPDSTGEPSEPKKIDPKNPYYRYVHMPKGVFMDFAA